MKMKKVVIIVLSIILFGLTSCDIYSSKSSNSSNIASKNNTYIINVGEIPSYDSVTDDNVCQIVAAKVMPASVEITCKIEYSYSVYQYSFFGKGTTKTTQKATQSGKATGMIINEDGYVLTNAHVVCVEGSSQYTDFQYVSREIYLNFADTDLYFEAEVVAYDEDLDLCLLKMDTSNVENVQYVTFFSMTNPTSNAFKEDSAVKLYYGETAIAIGNANGYGMSVTKGVVSAPYRIFNENGKVTYAIQTDASINEGNSGGPLCNSYGAIIGINSFKIVTSTSEGMGFAIPTYTILDYINAVDTSRQDITIKIYTTTERKN